jgi:hypothetical protein
LARSNSRITTASAPPRDVGARLLLAADVLLARGATEVWAMATHGVLSGPATDRLQQANIAHGPQQVNNRTVRAGAHAREIENKPNELLEQTYGERLDPSSAGTAAAVDSRMEAVGAVHGADNKRRQGRSKP